MSAAVRILGDGLREARQSLGMTQDEIAVKAWVSRGTVGMFETGQRTATSKYCARVDELLGVTRYTEMRDRIGDEDAYERVATLSRVEAQAVAIRSYSPLLVPGLMQTKAYMRHQFGAAWFSGASTADIDQLVETRIARQSVLDTVRSYLLLLDESVLRRAIGDRDVAREQFEHLLNLARKPNITLQILPFSTPAYPAAGPMVIFDLKDGSQAVHLDGPATGTTTTSPDIVQACSERFELLRSQAASIPESIRLIQARLKELSS